MANRNEAASRIAAGELLAYENAEIRSSRYNNDAFLIVSGNKPENGWKAMLVPSIYQEKQEYLHVEILKVRDFNGVSDDDSQYILSIPVDAIMGEKGIMLVGANGRKYIDKDAA